MVALALPVAIAGLLLAGIHALRPQGGREAAVAAGAASGAQPSTQQSDQDSGGASYQQNSPYDLVGLFGAPPVNTLQSSFGGSYSDSSSPSQTSALSPAVSSFSPSSSLSGSPSPYSGGGPAGGGGGVVISPFSPGGTLYRGIPLTSPTVYSPGSAVRSGPQLA